MTPKLKKNILRPGVAILVGALVFLEIRARFALDSDTTPKVRGLIAAREIKPGEKLQLRDFSFRIATRNEFPQDVVTDQELFLVTTSVLRAELKVGEVLTSALLQSEARTLVSRIPKGARAHILRFEHLIPVFPGNRVDIYLGGESGPVAEGLLVLRVHKESSGTAVVVAAKPAEIIELERARDQGKLVLALRNPEDTQRSENSSRGRRARKTRRTTGITVMTEGAE